MNTGSAGHTPPHNGPFIPLFCTGFMRLISLVFMLIFFFFSSFAVYGLGTWGCLCCLRTFDLQRGTYLLLKLQTMQSPYCFLSLCFSRFLVLSVCFSKFLISCHIVMVLCCLLGLSHHTSHITYHITSHRQCLPNNAGWWCGLKWG